MNEEEDEGGIIILFYWVRKQKVYFFDYLYAKIDIPTH